MSKQHNRPDTFSDWYSLYKTHPTEAKMRLQQENSAVWLSTITEADLLLLLREAPFLIGVELQAYYSNFYHLFSNNNEALWLAVLRFDRQMGLYYLGDRHFAFSADFKAKLKQLFEEPPLVKSFCDEGQSVFYNEHPKYNDVLNYLSYMITNNEFFIFMVNQLSYDLPNSLGRIVNYFNPAFYDGLLAFNRTTSSHYMARPLLKEIAFTTEGFFELLRECPVIARDFCYDAELMAKYDIVSQFDEEQLQKLASVDIEACIYLLSLSRIVTFSAEFIDAMIVHVINNTGILACMDTSIISQVFHRLGTNAERVIQLFQLSEDILILDTASLSFIRNYFLSVDVGTLQRLYEVSPKRVILMAEHHDWFERRLFSENVISLTTFPPPPVDLATNLNIKKSYPAFILHIIGKNYIKSIGYKEFCCPNTIYVWLGKLCLDSLHQTPISITETFRTKFVTGFLSGYRNYDVELNHIKAFASELLDHFENVNFKPGFSYSENPLSKNKDRKNVEWFVGIFIDLQLVKAKNFDFKVNYVSGSYSFKTMIKHRVGQNFDDLITALNNLSDEIEEINTTSYHFTS